MFWFSRSLDMARILKQNSASANESVNGRASAHAIVCVSARVTVSASAASTVTHRYVYKCASVKVSMCLKREFKTVCKQGTCVNKG